MHRTHWGVESLRHGGEGETGTGPGDEFEDCCNPVDHAVAGAHGNVLEPYGSGGRMLVDHSDSVAHGARIYVFRCDIAYPPGCCDTTSDEDHPPRQGDWRSEWPSIRP